MNRRSIPLVFAALAALALCSSCALLADPKPVISGQVRTFTSGFIYTRNTRAWTMFIYVEPLRRAPGGSPLYLEASFENPQPGAAALTASADSRQATSLGVKLESASVAGMRDGKVYAVTVRVYADKTHTQMLDTLHQPVAYHTVEVVS